MQVQGSTLPFLSTAFQTGSLPDAETTGPTAGSGTSAPSGPAPDASSESPHVSGGTALLSPGEIPTDTGAAEARVNAAVQQIIAAGSSSLDALDLLAKVMIQQNGLQRHEALQDRLEARQAAMTDLMNQAGSMTQEASQMAKAAVISVIVGAVSVAASFASTAAGAIKGLKHVGEEVENPMKLKSLNKDLGKLNGIKRESLQVSDVVKGAKLMKEIKEVKTSMANAKKFDAFIEGLAHTAKAGESSGRFVEGNTQSQNKLLEAKQKTDEAQAQNAGSMEDQMKATQQSLSDMCTQILSFLHDMQEAKAEGMAALTRA